MWDIKQEPYSKRFSSTACKWGGLQYLCAFIHWVEKRKNQQTFVFFKYVEKLHPNIWMKIHTTAIPVSLCLSASPSHSGVVFEWDFGHRVISPSLSCRDGRWCVLAHCLGTEPLLWAVGDTNPLMQGFGCCVGHLAGEKNLEPLQLNYKEIWQGSLKGSLQRLVVVTFIFSTPAVIAVIRRQHWTHLMAFRGIN